MEPLEKVSINKLTFEIKRQFCIGLSICLFVCFFVCLVVFFFVNVNIELHLSTYMAPEAYDRLRNYVSCQFTYFSALKLKRHWQHLVA